MDTVVSRALEVVDLERVMAILPHRDPMLFVGSVEVDVEEAKGTGYWHVRPDHPVFPGHYPDYPLFPGHLIAEMAAQVAGIVYAKTIGSGVEGVPLLVHSAFNYSRVVLPGDLLRARVSLAGEKGMRRVRAVCDCTKNGGEGVAEGEVEFAVFPPKAAQRLLRR